MENYKYAICKSLQILVHGNSVLLVFFCFCFIEKLKQNHNVIVTLLQHCRYNIIIIRLSLKRELTVLNSVNNHKKLRVLSLEKESCSLLAIVC